MPSYVDDNFGTYDMEDEDDLEFYRQVQAESVWKRCAGCHRRVKIRPDFGYCNTCAGRRERGEDIG